MGGMSKHLTSGAPVVVFDGVCNLCSASVQFIVRHDARGRFRFASAQSAAGREMLREAGLDPDDPASFMLLADGRTWLRSDAALEVARGLAWPWRMLGALRVVPRFVRDPVYDSIARHRYRWFGKRDQCMLPDAGLKARFIE